MTENVVCESRLKKYGAEAFMQHREEVCLAVRAVCFCLEFLQNQGNWSGRRIFVRESLYDRLSLKEEEKSWEKYGERDRRKACRELEKELKERKWRIGEQEIPLKNFLRQGLMLITGKTRADGMDPDQWSQLMESQAEVDGFQDFRAFLEAVYLLGFAELFEIQSMDTSLSLEGEHRDAERFLKALNPYIPEEGQPDYDLFCRRLLQEQEQGRRKAMEQAMEERDKKLARTVEEIPLFRLFREAIENMGEEEFGELTKPDREEEEVSGWENISGEEQESIRRERKTARIGNLASIFAYGGSRARHRLLKQLSGEEQMLVMEQWMAAFYPKDEEMLENRLARMARTAGLEAYSQETGRIVREAKEKLLGRPFYNED